jgi:hypothetical protein
MYSKADVPQNIHSTLKMASKMWTEILENSKKRTWLNFETEAYNLKGVNVYTSYSEITEYIIPGGHAVQSYMVKNMQLLQNYK